MLKCKQIIDLASNSLDTKLPWRIRWQMKLHLLMCKTCSRYFKQLQFLQKITGSLHNHCQSVSLSAAARKRISDSIKGDRQ